MGTKDVGRAFTGGLVGWSGLTGDDPRPFLRMETMKKIALSLAALFTLTAVVACNTIEGVGEDVEATGEAVSGASREVRD